MTTAQSASPLFVALTRVAERQLGDFHPQDLANTLWAFAKSMQSEAPLFTALARSSHWCVGEFKPQEVGNTVWAFVTAAQHTTPKQKKI